MSHYRLARRADADMAEVWLYVANDRPAAADRLTDRLIGHFAQLAANPEIGELRPALAKDLRQSIVGKYVILYRPRAEGVEIVRVIHGSRDIDEEFHRHWFE